MGKKYWIWIVKAWLLAGTLDLSAAFIDAAWSAGRTPLWVLQYIASALFGPSAFEHSFLSGIVGVGMHYMIALFWTTLCFQLYPWMQRHLPIQVLQALVYGLIIWIGMNLLILPLTRLETGSFHWGQALKGCLILVLAIGLPVSIIAKKAYKK